MKKLKSLIEHNIAAEEAYQSKFESKDIPNYIWNSYFFPVIPIKATPFTFLNIF